MSYTRRAVIKNVAFASAAGSSLGAMLGSLGCKKIDTSPVGIIAPAATIAVTPTEAFRIFFCGAWFFASDGGSRILAIGRDMLGDCPSGVVVPHLFPYGIYQHGTALDGGPKFLKPNSNNNSASGLHSVDVTGYRPSAGTSVASIFHYAAVNYGFYSLQSADSIQINHNASGLVRISLPIPSRIIAAALNSNATFNNPVSGKVSMQAPPTNPQGPATAHLFEYDVASGAQSLIVTPAGLGATFMTDKTQHFHFHTIADPSSVNPATDHGRDMFHNLLGALAVNGDTLCNSGLSFSNSCPGGIVPGPYISASAPYIDGRELDYDPDQCPSAGTPHHLIDLASCSGPGFGNSGG